MLIVALVLAVIGLAALVTAVVSSNEIVAWVCIGASALGVILLVVDAIRDRQRRAAATAAVAETAVETTEFEEVPVADEEAESGWVQEAETVQTAENGVTEDATEAVTVDAGPISEQQAEIETGEIETGEIETGPGTETEVLAADSAIAEEAPEVVAEDHPEEVVHDEPEFDTYSDDEPEYLPSAEESALHIVDESALNSGDSEQR
jgi:hypothetical protein